MKKIYMVLLIFFLITMSGGCDNGTDTVRKTREVPDCVVSNRTDGDYWLTIIANRKEIEDKEEFAKELIEQVRNDGFHRIKFFYEDCGEYPTGLRMSVYLTEEEWQNREVEPYMTINVTQENVSNGYNVVEHLDQFQFEIE